MKTRSFSRSFLRWTGDNWRERLQERRRTKKGQGRVLSSLRPSFEALEDRTLMSVLPQPIVSGQTDISGLATLSSPGQGGNESSPTVAVDPFNPQKLIAAFNYSPTKPPVDFHGDSDQTTFVEASFSTDGGKSWTLFFDSISNLGELGNLNDPSEMTSMSDPDQTLELADSPSVAIDRSGGAYMVYAEHNPDSSSGDVVLQKFDFSGATPVIVSPTVSMFDPHRGQILYGWSGSGPNASDAAFNPAVVVDNNPATFTDPATNLTQVDAFSGAVYVSWTTRTAPPNGGNPPPPPTFNPNKILVLGSLDHGATFSTQVPLDGNGFDANFGLNRDTAPSLVVSGASVAAASASSTVQASPAPSMTSFAGGATLSVTDQFYDGYVLTFTGGSNSGLSRTVTSYSSNGRVFTFSSPWTSTPAIGDPFVLSRTTPGQLTGVWDDFGSGSKANPPFDSIVSNSVSGGGGVVVAGSIAGTATVGSGMPIAFSGGNVVDAGGGNPNVPAVNIVTDTVSINDGRFTSITDLNVSIVMQDPALNDLNLQLFAPPTATSSVQAPPAPTQSSFAGGASLSTVPQFYDGYLLTFTSGANAGQSRTVSLYSGPTEVFSFATPWSTAPATGDTFTLSPGITLVENGVNPDGTANPPAPATAFGITGISLGTQNGVDVGTVFDDKAERNITDKGAMAPYIGHFRPEFGTLSSLFAGLPISAVTGTWKLQITDNRQETNSMTPFHLNSWSLNFTVGMQLSRQSTIATTHVLGALTAPYPLKPAVSPNIGIGPGLVIAQDNTLGSFSPFQGRIYVAFTAHDIFSGNPVDNTYIVLYHSDDGGQSWSPRTIVNDDSIADNFSEGTRPKFEPAIAVDQTTGTLVMSFLDTRNDAARARYSTYLATSIDGGNTFAPESFVNEAQTATDVITGNNVVVEPIPDNVSADNPNIDTTYGMGAHQALAVEAGHVYPVWAGNFNGNNLLYGRTSVERTKTDILTAQVEIAAGPRIVSSTMGPVQSTTVDGFTFNNTFTPDGLPKVQGFTVTFDRPIDPSTFTPSDVTVEYRDTVTPASQPGTIIPVLAIIPLDQGNFGPGAAPGATTFFVEFQTPQTGRGTYSYAVGPNIRDEVRSLVVTVTPGPQQTFNSTVNNQPIPDASDNGPGMIDNPITVSGLGAQVVTNVQVTVNIQHSQDADLTLTLIAPDGTPVTLAANQGSGNDAGNQNFTNTTFADGFPSINTGTAPYTGTFSPVGKLSDFIDKSPNGTWTLEITDSFKLNVGTLLNWTLKIIPGTKSGLTTKFGNLMDQNANAVTGQNPGDIFAIPTPINGVPFQLPYSQDTLPLIVPGPHIVSTFVSSVPSGQATSDNLAVNQTVSSIDIVFDRDMDPTTVTAAAVLRMMGPTGQITGPFTVTADPNPNYPRLINGVTTSAADPDSSHPRTFKISFPVQQLSGTYTISLASTVRAKAQPGQTVGDLLDTNENAGVDVLRGVNPTAASFLPVSHSYTGAPVVIAPGKITTIPLTFAPENFVIEGITLSLNITYPNDPDLEATLIAPDGTAVRLFTNVGGNSPPPRANFTNTVFDDSASTPIQSGVPPYNSSATGPFNPQTPLSVLKGKAAAGVYELVIKDDATSVTGVHQVNSWSITLLEAVPGTGLGEPVADQASVHFRIFTMDTQNPLAHDVWTAVGPASINGNGNSGRIGGLAVDPSDPSGNTVYVAGASGGVWKTTNFLTTDPNGPTYIPLTDFGPTFAINIGSIAVFGRNNDPNQSIIFASTGEGDTGSKGVGVIRSMDGGATWTLLDSSVNVDASGNPLPLNSVRDHLFVGSTSFKIVVDPVHAPSGPNDVVVYMALSGSAANGGLWRSLDSGKHWTRMTDTNGNNPSTTATDIVLAPASALGGNGNLQLVYAAFEGAGVYKSTSEGTNLTLMAGGAGNGDIRDFDFNPPASIPVNNDGVNPNGANGRIVLAAPSILTGNPIEDQLYEGWLYAAVVTTTGHLQGLYLTKDGGGNWTKIRLPVKQPDPTRPIGFPSNDESLPDHDPLGTNVGGTAFAQGNYDISLAVDPNNPNISYLGGTDDFQLEPASGLIRVDATNLFDPHNTVPFNNDDPDGGALERNTNGGITVKTAPDGFKYDAFGLVTNETPYVNLLTDPLNPFLSNSTLLLTHVASFSNEGSEAVWGPFDAVNGTTDQHRVIAMTDPLTGHTRLIFGDDQGVFSVVDRGDGTFTTGIGSAPSVNGSRNGNLQITQFYYGAAQPSNLAAQIGGALFYANAQDDGFPVSDPNLLNDGNIQWAGPTGDGTGIATDQTGSGTAYSYQWPCCGINRPTTDFFLVAPNGPGYISRTGTASGFSLVQQNQPGPVPDPQWPFLGVGVGHGTTDVVNSNFAVNPINNQQIVIGSAAGRIFRTLDQGNHWGVIGDPTTNTLFDGSMAPALAFGAPDPGNPTNNQGDFIYIGLASGKINVTLDGGGHWTTLFTSADGSAVVSISANPTRGSHEIYAVTTTGVFHITFTAAYPNNAAPTVSAIVMTNITANVFNLTTNFSNPNNSLLFQLTTSGTTVVQEQKPLAYLTSIVADWRFQVPDVASNPTGPTHPYLYVGGEGGVYRSTDKGKTWTIFPDIADDGSPVNGGYLPMAHVTDLDLAVGNINPTTGKPDQSAGFNILVATTYGRGDFAIRLQNNSPFNPSSGPVVKSLLPNTPGTSVSSVTVTFTAPVDPATFTNVDVSFIGPNGASILISPGGVVDKTPPPPPGASTYQSIFQINFSTQTAAGAYTMVIGPNIADFSGNLMDQDLDGINGGSDDAYTGRFFLNSTSSGPSVPAILGHETSGGGLWVGISNGTNAFNNAFFGTLSTSATWVNVVTGDFNGDGKTDVAARNLATGQWFVGINTGNSFAISTTPWATWNPAVTWVDVMVGDFNGDGKADIVGRWLQGGVWFVSASLGNSFNTTAWASWSPNATWVDTKVGDFDGAVNTTTGLKIDDITSRWLEGGSLWTGISNGGGFATSMWAQWNPNVTWVDVNVGDFNGDGKADIAGRWLQGGVWFVGTSSATSFNTAAWATWNPNVTWADVRVGDFTGDGKTDIIGRWQQAGVWYVGTSTGTSFNTTAWATWNPNITWTDIVVGDFNGDRKADIAERYLQGGAWFAGISNGTGFTTSFWDSWSPAVNWTDVQLVKSV